MNRSTRTRRLHSRGFLALIGATLATLFFASTSNAGAIYYTSWVLADKPGNFVELATTALELDSGSSWAGADSRTTTSLGDGYLTQGHRNHILVWHDLTPKVRMHSIDGVYVYVGFQDKSKDTAGQQIVKIKVDGDLTFQGPTSTGIIGGSVDTETAENGQVRIRLDLRRGETSVLGTLVGVNYDAAPVPEPGSLMLFAAGAGVVALSIRNRR